MKNRKRPTLYQRIHGGRHRGRRRDKFYDLAVWKKLRAFILLTKPICADPFDEHEKHGEIAVPAVEVDHIVPRKQNSDLELDPENLQGLCHRCHSMKTAKENS